MDFLKGHSVKERQLPVSLILLHRRPRDEKLIVWAEAAVGPSRDTQTSAVQNPKHISQESRSALKLNDSHCKVVGEPRGCMDGFPEVPNVPHLQRIIT